MRGWASLVSRCQKKIKNGGDPPLTLEGRVNDFQVFDRFVAACVLRCSYGCASIQVLERTRICIVYFTFCFKYFPILTKIWTGFMILAISGKRHCVSEMSSRMGQL